MVSSGLVVVFFLPMWSFGWWMVVVGALVPAFGGF